MLVAYNLHAAMLHSIVAPCIVGILSAPALDPTWFGPPLPCHIANAIPSLVCRIALPPALDLRRHAHYLIPSDIEDQRTSSETSIDLSVFPPQGLYVQQYKTSGFQTLPFFQPFCFQNWTMITIANSTFAMVNDKVLHLIKEYSCRIGHAYRTSGTRVSECILKPSKQKPAHPQWM